MTSTIRLTAKNQFCSLRITTQDRINVEMISPKPNVVRTRQRENLSICNDLKWYLDHTQCSFKKNGCWRNDYSLSTWAKLRQLSNNSYEKHCKPMLIVYMMRLQWNTKETFVLTKVSCKLCKVYWFSITLSSKMPTIYMLMSHGGWRGQRALKAHDSRVQQGKTKMTGKLTLKTKFIY